MLSLNSKLRTNRLLPNIWKITPSARVQEKNIFKLPCALQLWCLAQSHLPQWDYIKFEMSTSIQTVRVGQKWIWWGGGGGNLTNKRSDQITLGMSSTRRAILNSRVGISLLVCTLSPPAFLPSSLLPAAQQIEAMTGAVSSNHQSYSGHDAHPLELGQGFPTWNWSGLHSVTSHLCYNGTYPALAKPYTHPSCHTDAWRWFIPIKPLQPHPPPKKSASIDNANRNW